MSVRAPVAAGRFYEADPEQCRQHVQEMLPETPPALPFEGPIRAAVVPHAGWVFSGDLAARVFAAIADRQAVDTFVVFGAAHTLTGPRGCVFREGQWDSPLGCVAIDEAFARALLDSPGGLFVPEDRAHQHEHSIEVQVPIIQVLFPDARLVPVVVPANQHAAAIGRQAARVAGERPDTRTVFVGSTDLTHYGPSYCFTPMGTGAEGVRWAKETNDRFFIDQALAMQADRLVDTAQTYQSACGGGATAATVAAAAELGVRRGHLLAHTTSAEVMAQRFGQAASDSVGYAAIVYG